MKTLSIIYRCCEKDGPAAPYRPPYFSKETCLRNALGELLYKDHSKSVSFTIVHDGDRGPIYDIASENKDVNLIKINEKSNIGSYLACLDILEADQSEASYMIEDDYLHTSNALSLLREGLDQFGILTGYFHTDRLTRSDDITKGYEWIGATKSSHWVTNESTTCTWAVTQNYRANLVKYARAYKLMDRQMWRSLYRDLMLRLWVPTPAFSTHMMGGLMSPFINWKEVHDRYSNF